MRNNFMHETCKKDQESDGTRKKDVDVAAVKLLDLDADNVKCD